MAIPGIEPRVSSQKARIIPLDQIASYSIQRSSIYTANWTGLGLFRTDL